MFAFTEKQNQLTKQINNIDSAKIIRCEKPTVAVVQKVLPFTKPAEITENMLQEIIANE